jgi:hypothetical protein
MKFVAIFLNASGTPLPIGPFDDAEAARAWAATSPLAVFSWQVFPLMPPFEKASKMHEVAERVAPLAADLQRLRAEIAASEDGSLPILLVAPGDFHEKAAAIKALDAEAAVMAEERLTVTLDRTTYAFHVMPEVERVKDMPYTYWSVSGRVKGRK